MCRFTRRTDETLCKKLPQERPVSSHPRETICAGLTDVEAHNLDSIRLFSFCLRSSIHYFVGIKLDPLARQDLSSRVALPCKRLLPRPFEPLQSSLFRYCAFCGREYVRASLGRRCQTWASHRLHGPSSCRFRLLVAYREAVQVQVEFARAECCSDAPASAQYETERRYGVYERGVQSSRPFCTTAGNPRASVF